MLKNMWYGIMRSDEVPYKKPISVKRMNKKLVMWRKKDGSIACIEDKCCHRGASIGLGQVNGDFVACPFHGFEYDEQGQVQLIPANGKIDIVGKQYQNNAYPIKEDQGFVFLFNGSTDLSHTKALPTFVELSSFESTIYQEIWPVHYTRAVENQLDVVHVPFVHHNTIGRGSNTLVDGPVVIEHALGFDMYVHSSADDGTRKGLKPSDIDDYASFFKLSFNMPNMWQNHISDKLRISICFAPIDDHHTLIYMAYHHKLSRLPLLKQFISYTGMVFSKIILHQDRRIVITQPPEDTYLATTEKLISADAPIITFRKLNAMNRM